MANISLSLHTPSSPVNFLHFKHRMEWLQKRSILIELGSTGSGGQLTLTFSSGEVKEYCLTATFNVYNACFAAFGSLSCSINKIESHSLRRLRTHWAIVDRTLAEHSTAQCQCCCCCCFHFTTSQNYLWPKVWVKITLCLESNTDRQFCPQNVPFCT